ncbi:hypothetical protein [Neptuniibacter marinus]|uniref:hypothetical protein n=1 Tax=Neptuniibacter marinus TaxID=1806670 RepID=UPI003B593CB7
MLATMLRAASLKDSPSIGGIPSDFIARYVFSGDYDDETENYDATNSGSSFVEAGDGPAGTDAGITTGAGAFLTLPTSLASALGAGAGTASFAVRTASFSSVLQILTGSDISSNNKFLSINFDPSTSKSRIVSNSVNVYTSNAISTSAWTHVIIRTTGSSTSFRIGGVNTTKTVTAGSDTGAWFGDISSIDNMHIGKLQRTTAIAGGEFDIAYMTLYSRHISDAECVLLENEYI